MPRSAASIQQEIDCIEAELCNAIKAQNYSTGNRSVSRANYQALSDRLNRLYQMLDRVTGAVPMLTRSRVANLGRGKN